MRLSIQLILFLLCFSLKIKAQTTLVPDTNFRNFLIANYGGVMNKNKLLVDSLAIKISGTMNCSGKGITSLSGLEKFNSLTGLDCSNNSLTSINEIKNLSNISVLKCYNNKIAILPDLTKLANLSYFTCSGNIITDMPNLSNNVALYHLDCYDNRISKLPGLEKLINLQYLNAYNNQIDTLPDLSKLIKLSVLQCFNNKLKTISGLQNLVSLTQFTAGNNPLKSLPDLSKLVKMQQFMCWSCQLNLPPATFSMPDLVTLDLNTNNLSNLPDLSQNKKLVELRFQENRIDTIVGLKSLGLLQNINLKFNGVKNINDLIVAQNSLKEIVASNNQIKSVPDFSKFKSLQLVNIQNNKLNFNDLLPFLQIPTLSDTAFEYAPQQQLAITNSILLTENAAFNYTIGFDKTLKTNVYTWTKNKSFFSQKSTDSLTLNPVHLTDSGTYYCTITNAFLPKLTLSTSGLRINVLPCIDLSNLKYSTIDIDCEKGGKLFVDQTTIKGGKPPYQLKLISSILGKTHLPQNNSFSGLSEKQYQLSISEISGCKSTIPISLGGKDFSDCKSRVIVATASGESANLFLEEQGFARVYDKSGKQVHSFRTPGTWDGSSDRGDLPPGMYLVEYNDSSFNVTVIR